MAKLIEFYVPSGFSKPMKRVAQGQEGKLIEFRVPTTKSA
jgi:hypothetical protein